MTTYILFQTGPDNGSTYPECWGTTGKSDGREIARATTLVGLIDAVEGLAHDNFWVKGPGGRQVAGSREEFRSLRPVRKALAGKE